MKRYLTLKKIALTVLVFVLIAIGYAAFIYFQPHRDVQSAKTDFTYRASDIVNEYLKDPIKANEKYLDEEGDSKIIEVTGTITSIEENYSGEQVIILSDNSAPAGVSCTLLAKTSENLFAISEGKIVTVKGVIRAGASYDEDLGMYENVILEKCAIVNN